jgi:hypothetical protein
MMAYRDKLPTHAATKKGELPTQLYRHSIAISLAVIGSDIRVGRAQYVYTFLLGSAEGWLGDIGL